MAPRLSERQQAVLFAGILIVAIAGLYSATLAIQPAEVRTAVVRMVHLEVEGEGWTIQYGPPVTSNNTAFSLLMEASTRLDFSVRYRLYQIPEGVLVTEINGSANGQRERYWQYWVNDVYATIAADRKALQDGDFVVWRFASYQGGA